MIYKLDKVSIKGASLFEAGLNLGLGESSRLSPVNLTWP